MASYSEWNKALCNFLFNEDKLGKPVYLHVPEEAFDDDSSLKVLGGYSGFKADMLAELGRCPDELILCAENKWAKDKRSYLPGADNSAIIPGHLALMLVLAAASEIDDESIESNAYYSRIPIFFGIKNVNKFKLREAGSVTSLFNRIQTWSEKDCEGKLGIFRTHILGAHINVGLIQAQTIFKPSDIEELWLQFRKAGYRPGDQYSASDFENILISGSFSQRIKKALSKPELKQVALLRVQEELESWNGKLAKSAEGRTDLDDHTVGKIILQVYTENPIDKQQVVGIRLRDSRDYFDNYDVLIPKRNQKESIKRTVSPDSNELGLTNVVLKPSEAIREGAASFTQNFDIYSEDRNFVFKYRSRKVRYFVEPSTIGYFRMSGWIEVPAIIKGVKHLLMIERSFEDEFLKCNESRIKREQNQHLKFSDDYTPLFFFMIVERITDTLVDYQNNIIGSFAIADRPKIRPIWGLKADVAKRNSYLRECPPQIIQFTGLDEDCQIHIDCPELFVNDNRENVASSVAEYRINTNLNIPDTVNISVVKNEITLARFQLNFVDHKTVEVTNPFVNAIGEILKEPATIDRYRPSNESTSGPRQPPEVKLVGKQPSQLCDLKHYKNNFQVCWIAEVRGAQKTFHFVGPENLLTTSDYRYELSYLANNISNSNDNLVSWKKFICDDSVRCGISAKPLNSFNNLTPHSVYVKRFLDQQRQIISKKFP